MKIGIFGGTFNPVHNGHLHLAESFFEFLGLDFIYIIPNNKPPHKTDVTSASPLDRLNMCKLSFTKPYYIVSEIEINRGGASYTIDTLNDIKKLHEKAEIYLLIGADMFLSFDKWYRYQDILELCKLCAIARTDSGEYELMLEYKNESLAAYDSKILIMQAKPYPLSSTQIRQMLKKGLPIGDYVPKKVAEYIKSRRLYID